MYGVHVSRPKGGVKTLAKCLEEAGQMDMRALQIFTHGPLNTSKTNYNAEEIATVVDTLGINLYIHSPYMMSGIWNSTKLHNLFEQMLHDAAEINAEGVVVHYGKQSPENIINVTKKIASSADCDIYLEMAALHPTQTTAETPEKLNALIQQCEAKLCVDTAHFWAAGQNIKYYEDAKNWFNKITVLDQFRLIHLNGSFNELGSGKDKHAIIAGRNDLIWGDIENKGESGLRAIFEIAKSNRIDMVQEINFMNQNDFNQSLDLIRTYFNN